MALRKLEAYIMRRLDIRVTFALLCTAIFLLVMMFSSSLSSNGHPSRVPESGYKNLWEEEERHLDIHLEGPQRGHLGLNQGLAADSGIDSVVSRGELHHSHPKPNRTSIAVGLAITARDQEFLTLENVPYRTPFLKTLLPSFCKTVSPNYEYHFYVAFDSRDPYLSQEDYLRAIYTRFLEVVKQLCPTSSEYRLHFVQCRHNRSPSWAQNDAMMEAYLDNMDFYYRVNDDTQMMSPGWTEAFIEGLKNFHPPYIGVVGPVHKGGNEVILTYDFVHSSHIDVFGYYYPRLFTDWWADNWMSEVYGEERTLKLPSVRVMHTLEAGTRYKVQYDISKLVQYQLAEDRATLKRYLKTKLSPNPAPSDLVKVISLSLWGSDARYTFGALRNAQLVGVYFPGWRLRVYVEKLVAAGKTQHPPVPQRILEKLAELGAEVLYVNAQQSHIPPMMWRFLVADDTSIDNFIVRDADARLSDRDALVVQEWLHSGRPFHCVRDHPSHAQYALLGGLWGARPRPLKDIIVIPWQDLMMGYRGEYVMDMAFLANAVWPKVQKQAYCHDSVSCESWPGAHPFPVARAKAEHVGQVFDAFGNARDDDVRIIMERPANEACVKPKYNLTEQAVGENGVKGDVKYMGLTFEGDTKQDAPSNIIHPTSPGNSSKNTGSSSHHISLPTQPQPQPDLPAKISATPVMWSIDFHSGPIRDIKDILLPFQVRFLDQSFSSKCHYTQNCATNLRVLNKKNGLLLDKAAIQRFYAEYENDPQMSLVTHYLCTYPVALCELYLRFGKPLIIYVTHRYELGRYSAQEWQVLNSHLQDIAQNAENTIAASNKYDAAYVEYFTGIRSQVIPLLCKYVHAHYKPTKQSVLLAPFHNPTFEDFLFAEFDREKKLNANLTTLDVVSMTQAYPEGYTFQDLASHLAIIHIPYQASTMMFCEHYYMDMPLFVPTLDLLIDWHLKYDLLSALTYNSIRGLIGEPKDSSPLPGKTEAPDPNKITDKTSLQHWLRLADFYQRPHLVYFSTVGDLMMKLQKVDLLRVSAEMNAENKRQKVRVVDQWKKVLRGI